jgi:hypothetical protein
MRRCLVRLDIDLIREILLSIEVTPANHDAGSINLPDRDEDEVLEHLDLLNERGLIIANVVRSGSSRKGVYAVFVKRLTAKGHEFLANARNEEVWNQTKRIVKEKGGSASFEIITGLVTQVAAKFFGLS